MRKRYFIAGTDTGVGKTFVTALLARAFPQCGVCKPIQTGYPGDEDLRYIAQAAGLAGKQIYNPRHFTKPLAPQQACAQDGLPPINTKKLTQDIVAFCQSFAVSFIEGAGGLYVPINRGYYMLDLIKDLRAEVVLVCRAGLGTVNHTLLSLAALRRRRIKIKGLVFNQTSPPDISAADNPRLIQEISGLPLLGIFPYQKKLNPKRFKINMNGCDFAEN
ncbi:dethiobiotin synthase [Candidatus Termititenax persephonae]|uniref:ATP-dependent dethiobiotin synthetase BioD n=1 Tax=Candidatus Termititenax persephonae TaxID=2218525 RepID=A0A388TFM2_9BACT|nr:dethiobiotin synthase [Candidatus Termititenax persephonae]